MRDGVEVRAEKYRLALGRWQLSEKVAALPTNLSSYVVLLDLQADLLQFTPHELSD
jgi:hypothetical protein